MYDSLKSPLKDSLHSSILKVNDFNGLYNTDQKNELDSMIADFEKQSGLKIVIITLDSNMASKDSVELVTRIIGVKNRINTTIGISVPHRVIHIWNDSIVNTTLLNESSTKAVIDNYITPRFAEGEYYLGTIEGLKKIIQRMSVILKNPK